MPRATMMLASIVFASALLCMRSAAADIRSAPLVHRRRNQQQLGRRRAQANFDERGAWSGRQLSVDDQLNILKLGFIPPRTDARGDGLERDNDVHLFGRGGGVDDEQPRPVALASIVAFLSSLFGGHSSRGGGVEEGDGEQPRVYFPPLAFASTMAFLAGYSNVICLRKFHCYAAMMSGNVVTLSVAVAEQKWKEALGRLSLVGGYLLGAAGVRAIELVHRRGAEPETTQGNQHLTIVAPIVAVIFAAANQVVATVDSGDQRWKIALLAFAYGMVYASANQALNGTITQLLTGHITKLGTAMSDRFVGPSRQWNAGSLLSVCILGSFGAGGACGTRSLPLVPKDFPYFTVLGIVYALVLAFYGDMNTTYLLE